MENSPNTFECANCSEKHITRRKDCKREQKERRIKEVQNEEGVGRCRVIQIMSGEGTEPTTNTKKYVSHFSCIMTLEGKISFTPWSIEKSTTQELGTTLKTIRSQSETKFVIEVDSEKGSVNMPKIKKLHNAVVKKWK